MLNEAKLNCQAMDPFYEPELCRLIQAGLTVLRTRGISFEGTFEYETEQDDDSGMPLVVGHTCTVTDDWIRTAVLNYEGEVPRNEGSREVHAGVHGHREHDDRDDRLRPERRR